MAARLTLVILGLVSMIRGWAYLGPSPDETPALLILADALVPLEVMGGVWILFGCVGIAAAVRLELRPIALGLTLFMNALWLFSITYSWLFMDSPRGWVNAATYALLSWLLYRECTRREVPDIPKIGSS